MGDGEFEFGRGVGAQRICAAGADKFFQDGAVSREEGIVAFVAEFGLKFLQLFERVAGLGADVVDVDFSGAEALEHFAEHGVGFGRGCPKKFLLHFLDRFWIEDEFVAGLNCARGGAGFGVGGFDVAELDGGDFGAGDFDESENLAFEMNLLVVHEFDGAVVAVAVDDGEEVASRWYGEKEGEQNDSSHARS